MEYWSPTPLPEGDPGKDVAAPAELRQPAEEEIELSSDSSVGDPAIFGRPEKEDAPRHEEDPAVEGGVGGSATVAEELDPKGDEQGSGSVSAPGYCRSGVGIGQTPSREGGGTGTRPAVRGSDAPAYQLWGSAGLAAEAQVLAASKQWVSF